MREYGLVVFILFVPHNYYMYVYTTVIIINNYILDYRHNLCTYVHVYTHVLSADVERENMLVYMLTHTHTNTHTCLTVITYYLIS